MRLRATHSRLRRGLWAPAISTQVVSCQSGCCRGHERHLEANQLPLLALQESDAVARLVRRDAALLHVAEQEAQGSGPTSGARTGEKGRSATHRIRATYASSWWLC